jgi:hypothetical protein
MIADAETAANIIGVGPAKNPFLKETNMFKGGWLFAGWYFMLGLAGLGQLTNAGSHPADALTTGLAWMKVIVSAICLTGFALYRWGEYQSARREFPHGRRNAPSSASVQVTTTKDGACDTRVPSQTSRGERA